MCAGSLPVADTLMRTNVWAAVSWLRGSAATVTRRPSGNLTLTYWTECEDTTSPSDDVTPVVVASGFARLAPDIVKVDSRKWAPAVKVDRRQRDSADGLRGKCLTRKCSVDSRQPAPARSRAL